jgi:uncharacterized protein (DUF1778 family)
MSLVKNKSRVEQSRLNFRLTPEIKSRVVRAATVVGQDLTEFAVATLSQRADEVLEKHDNLLLGTADYQFFLDALSVTKTPKASKKSMKAADNYRQGIRKGARYHLAD